MTQRARGKPAMCVVSVDDGPGGVRWAQVSVQLDELSGRPVVTRSRTTSGTFVLARVTEFLQAAGLDMATEVPAGPE